MELPGIKKEKEWGQVKVKLCCVLLFFFQLILLSSASEYHISIAANETVPEIISSTEDIGNEINIFYLVRNYL